MKACLLVTIAFVGVLMFWSEGYRMDFTSPMAKGFYRVCELKNK